MKYIKKKKNNTPNAKDEKLDLKKSQVQNSLPLPQKLELDRRSHSPWCCNATPIELQNLPRIMEATPLCTNANNLIPFIISLYFLVPSVHSFSPLLGIHPLGTSISVYKYPFCFSIQNPDLQFSYYCQFHVKFWFFLFLC